MNTIEQAIRPLFLICHVLGICVYTSKPYLSTLYNIIIWCVYSFLFHYTMIALQEEKWILGRSSLIYNGIIFLVTIICVIISLYQHMRLKKFIKGLAAVDDTLEELGTPKMYRTLHICIIRILIVWLLYNQMANTCDISWYCHITKNKWCTLMPYILNYMEFANMSVNLLFTICLWYISTRFEKLNGHIKCLFRNKYDIRYTWKKIVVPTHRYIMYINNYKRILWITMHLHLELCQLTRELSAIFEIQITIEMVTHLVHFIRIFRYIYIHLTENGNSLSLMEWINVYIRLFLHVTMTFCLNFMCDRVSAKSSEMNIIIHRLTNSPRCTNIRNEIHQFTLQLMYNPLKLYGLGLLDFGSGFLRKFIMTIMMFLIIVIQMPGVPKTFTY